MIHVLAQTFTSTTTVNQSGQITQAIVALILGLIAGAAILVPALLSWARDKLELERIKTRNALEEAQKTKVVNTALVRGTEAVMASQAPGEAKKTKEILAAHAEESGRFSDVRATVREVTHPEEKKNAP